jgi:hypothetical protein
MAAGPWHTQTKKQHEHLLVPVHNGWWIRSIKGSRTLSGKGWWMVCRRGSASAGRHSLELLSSVLCLDSYHLCSVICTPVTFRQRYVSCDGPAVALDRRYGRFHRAQSMHVAADCDGGRYCVLWSGRQFELSI